jgi:CheY-like chemotaxis protein
MPRAVVAARLATIRERYRQVLSDLDYEVETAVGGVDCMEKLRQARTDILLLDLYIPWGGGDGVLHAMRDDRVLREVPVVLIPVVGYPQGIEGLVPLAVAEALIKLASDRDTAPGSLVPAAHGPSLSGKAEHSIPQWHGYRPDGRRLANRSAETIEQILREVFLIAQTKQSPTATGKLALRDLEFRVIGGLSILAGRVPTYYLKQLAQNAARSVSEVKTVHKRIDVVRQS